MRAPSIPPARPAQGATARREAASQKFFEEIQPRKRRKEIIRHGCHVCLGDNEWLERHAIAWWHHKPERAGAENLIDAMAAMGFHLLPADAAALINEANATAPLRTADEVARFLKVTWANRQELRLWTIGAIDVPKAERKRFAEMRLDRQRQRRWAAGTRPQSQSLAQQQPWTKLGWSRAKWFRKRKAAPDLPSPSSEGQTAVRLVCDLPVKEDYRFQNSLTGFPVSSQNSLTSLLGLLRTASTLSAPQPARFHRPRLAAAGRPGGGPPRRRSGPQGALPRRARPGIGPAPLRAALDLIINPKGE
jgi:hypothetical protein